MAAKAKPQPDYNYPDTAPLSEVEKPELSTRIADNRGDESPRCRYEFASLYLEDPDADVVYVPSTN